MKIELKEIRVRDLAEGYQDNDEEGVVGYSGRFQVKMFLTFAPIVPDESFTYFSMGAYPYEPLLAGVTTVCEPFCGKGNLVMALRARGLTVHASDIQHRGCPDSTVLDFRRMNERPPGCDVLVSNPAFDGIAGGAMEFIEHALALRFRVVALLLKQSFLSTEERFERLHKPGHLRRVHILAERVQDMHDANHTGNKVSQNAVHAWFVFDREYYGPATINPVSIYQPTTRMPWAAQQLPAGDNGNGYHGIRGTSRGYVLARLARDGRAPRSARLRRRLPACHRGRHRGAGAMRPGYRPVRQGGAGVRASRVHPGRARPGRRGTPARLHRLERP
jgi:hypothetical protein